jgi:hypothetical protein
MKQYAVSINVNGRNAEEVVMARSAADAIAVVRARYPQQQVFIYGARPIG